jgi:hypothetical protein
MYNETTEKLKYYQKEEEDVVGIEKPYEKALG